MCDAEYYEGCCERCEETKQVLENYNIGETICDRCFDDNFGKCNNCGNECLIAMLIENNYNCEKCIEEMTCERCGVLDGDTQYGMCDDCYSAHIESYRFSTKPMDRFVCVDDEERAEKKKPLKFKIVGVYEP